VQYDDMTNFSHYNTRGVTCSRHTPALRATCRTRSHAASSGSRSRRVRRADEGLQVVRRGEGVRAAIVPAHVPMSRVRGGRPGVPRVCGLQERLAPRPPLLSHD
jgi:hypothetical protein